MHIRFAEADKAFMTHQVEQGLFTSETELVRAAVRDMRERRANRFYQAIQAGADDVRRGRTMPLTDALKAEIVEKYFCVSNFTFLKVDNNKFNIHL